VRIDLGSDHPGYELKTRLTEWLAGAGHEPVDCGPGSCIPADYPMW
jgi:ribose 5-phosphate isomerase B